MNLHTHTPDTALFDFESFLERIVKNNIFAQVGGFHFCTASGIGALEGVLSSYRQKQAFVVLDQITDATTYRRGGVWFQRRVYTVMILHRYPLGNMEGYHQALGICRTLYLQLLSYLVEVVGTQNTDPAYLDVENVRYRELGAHFLPSTTGLHFHLTADEIVNLNYDPKQWKQKENTTSNT